MKDALARCAQEIVEQVSTVAEDVFAPLDPLRAEVERLFAAGRPTVAQLAQLRPSITATLGGPCDLVVGSGFIAAPGVLADGAMALEWWKIGSDGTQSRLVLDLDPASAQFEDYTRQPWFDVPERTGSRHITGPYVDYLCTDEYTLTFTVPAYADGEFVGVVGSDIYVSGFELAVLRRLRSVAARAALVNAQGRVIVSNNARQVTGSLVRDPDVAAMWQDDSEVPTRSEWALHRSGSFPVALLVGPRP